MRLKKRDYKDEYKKFQMGGQLKKRALRNKNRRKLMAGGRVRKGDGKDTHHVGSKLTAMYLAEPKTGFPSLGRMNRNGSSY